MWQRVQSVFLGLVIFSLLASLFLPIWGGTIGDTTYRLYPIYFMTKIKGATADSIVSSYVPFALTSILVVAGITVAVQAFRRFDNRVLQLKLGMLNSLILVGVMVSMILFSNEAFKAHPGVKGGYDLSLYLCFAAVVFNWLAMRFIRRDEKLVRDSDRLR